MATLHLVVVGLSTLYMSFQLLAHIVPCLSLSIVQSNIDTGRASLARPKNDFSVRELEKLMTPDGLPALERLSSFSLPSGKLLLLLNNCSTADEHDAALPPFDEQIFFGCDVNLQQIDSSNNWQRYEMQLIGSTDLPEVRGVGFWAEEANGEIDKVVLLVWTASCKTQQETCRCNKEDGCNISFGNNSQASCLSAIYGGKVAPQGARLCQGTSNTETNGECYYYSLEAKNGWGCGSASKEPVKSGRSSGSKVTPRNVNSWETTRQDIWNRHGVRLGSAIGVRYGTLFFAEFNGYGELQYVRSIAHNVIIPYGQEQRKIIASGEASGADGLVEKQYAVTFVREMWKWKTGSVIVSPKCETILLNSTAMLEDSQIQGNECDSCLYTSVSVHPVTGQWASMCISTKLPKMGISINGFLVVDSNSRYQSETKGTVPLDESLSYYKDVGGRLLPTEGGRWVLIWRQESWKVSDVEGLNTTSATIKAAVWEGVNETLETPVSLFGPLQEHRLMNLDAVSLSLQSALVTVADYVNEEANAGVVDLSRLSTIGPGAVVTVAGVQGGALFGLIYGHPLLRLSESTALWLGDVKENTSPSVGPSTLLPDWEPFSTSRAVIISINQDEEACQGQWEATTSTCPSSCLQEQGFRERNTSGNCPWEPHAFRIVHCEGGDCPDWREGALVFAGNKAAEANELLDKDLSSMVTMGPQMDSIELRLADPIDLEAVEVYVHRANVSLVLSIQDVEENCLYRITSAFSAPPLEMGVAAYPWVTRYLSLKRVSTLLLQAAPLTSSEEGKWAVDILEIRLQSTPSLPCAAGGFSDMDKGCEVPLETPSSLDSLDCEGDWEDWSICDTSCTRTRRFRVTALPKEGGIPCVTHEVEPCTGGGLCSISGSAKNILRGSLRQQKDSESSTPGSSTNCASTLSSKSQCVSCLTTYLVEFIQGGLLGGKTAGCVDYTAAPPSTISSSTMHGVNSYSGSATYGNRTVPTRNSVVSKRNSALSQKFGNGIQAFRQSLLGGNLLRNASEDESDCLGDSDTGA
ncbi:hypothetical protein, conserved [Eimeria maxima]|uniref:Thrombospondin type 1 domain-containing protein n=1 Tax=Eimeria maxima TaxID=5804 RepID=U6LYY0_EIMMA|nr:hypothetical protein, conserved [Eimeria maxima]CDJ56966.1 hypothetical protein, conserved [Eimeria maxima]